MLRSQVVLCCGEDEADLDRALQSVGIAPTDNVHRYRQSRFWATDSTLFCHVGVGTPVVEAVLWELLNAEPIKQTVLVGTAGSMPRCTAKPATALLLSPVESAMQAFDSRPGQTWEPTLNWDLAAAAGVSTDRFYGFSPLANDSYPADPAMIGAWNFHRERDLVVDMEAAPFYAFCQQFDRTGSMRYAAVKAVANAVDDLAGITAGAPAALTAVMRAVKANMDF